MSKSRHCPASCWDTRTCRSMPPVAMCPAANTRFWRAHIMSVITAKVAGVEAASSLAPRRSMASPRARSSPRRRHGRGGMKSTRWAASRRSARWRSARRRSTAVDMLVGTGQCLRRRGQTTIVPGGSASDLFAGPTETLIIADEFGCDPELAATDILGQVEHGPDSPGVLLTNSDKFARATMAEVERLLQILPDRQACVRWPGRTTAK